MALAPCPECRNQLSTDALNCPACGYVLPRGLGYHCFRCSTENNLSANQCWVCQRDLHFERDKWQHVEEQKRAVESAKRDNISIERNQLVWALVVAAVAFVTVSLECNRSGWSTSGSCGWGIFWSFGAFGLSLQVINWLMPTRSIEHVEGFGSFDEEFVRDWMKTHPQLAKDLPSWWQQLNLKEKPASQISHHTSPV